MLKRRKSSYDPSSSSIDPLTTETVESVILLWEVVRSHLEMIKQLNTRIDLMSASQGELKDELNSLKAKLYLAQDGE